jgi:hypothetical protein
MRATGTCRSGPSRTKGMNPSLFSDAAKGLDRTLLPADEAKELDAKIAAFLPLFGKDLIEW